SGDVTRLAERSAGGAFQVVDRLVAFDLAQVAGDVAADALPLFRVRFRERVAVLPLRAPLPAGILGGFLVAALRALVGVGLRLVNLRRGDLFVAHRLPSVCPDCVADAAPNERPERCAPLLPACLFCGGWGAPTPPTIGRRFRGVGARAVSVSSHRDG